VKFLNAINKLKIKRVTYLYLGTYYFLAPELLDMKQEDTIDGKTADIWSLGNSHIFKGITMYAFAYLKVPF